MVQTLLVGLYILLFLVILRRWSFFRLEGLGKLPLTAIFLLKVTFAIFYGVLYQTYYQGGDTLNYFVSGQLIFSHLFESPVDYLYMVFGPGSGTPPAHLAQLADDIDYWNSSGSYFMVRFHALFSLFSFGYYNVHAVFMAFLSLTGLSAIYKLVAGQYQNKQVWFIIVIFLIPSILLYGSALHKEALIIFFLGLMIFHFKKLLDKEFTFIPALIFLISGVAIFMIKAFVFAALLPCIIAYMWYKWKPHHVVVKFATAFVIFWVLAFNADLLIPAFDLEQIIATKQAQFIAIEGQSDLQTASIEPTGMDWIQFLPQALLNTTLRPYPTEIQTVYHAFYWLELLFILVFTFFVMIFPDRRKFQQSSLVYFAFFFFLALIFIIGLVVDNLGAISRYKTPALLFYLIFLVIILDVRKAERFFSRRFKWLE